MVLKKFEFNGQEYEIRAIQDYENVTIRVFISDIGTKTANGLLYVVNNSTCNDIKAMQGTNLVTDLLRIAENDVRNNVWEKYTIALKEFRKGKANNE